MRIAGNAYRERLEVTRTVADVADMAREIAHHIPRMHAACPTAEEFELWFVREVDSIRRNAADSLQAQELEAHLRAVRQKL